MAPLAHLPSLRSASLHAPKGLSFAAYALLAVLYALVGPALYQTSGEPLATATAHYSRLGATTKLDSATERRDPLQLQAALTDCAELMAADASFAASATAGRFDISRQLLRAMHDATAQLDAAADLADSGEASRAVASFTAALNRAAAPFAAEPAGPAGDFLPLLGAPVLRRHAGTLRVLLAKLGEAKSGDADFSAREEAERAADAAERTAAHAESMLPPDVEPVQTKLPPWYMPSFLPSVCALLLLLAHSLLHLGAHWNSGFRCLLYFHPTTQLRPGSHVLASPLAHRGKQEIVPVTPGDGGRLFIVFHKQKYECLGPEAAAAGGGYSDAAGAPGTAATGDKEADTAGGLVGLGGGACGAIVPVRCPVAEPLASYVESGGLSAARAEAAMRLYGKNEFSIPLPTFGDLYLEQISSPIAVFQIFCSVLWMLDDYWKYTLFTLGMILAFEATTALQRQHNMRTLRGMNTSGQTVLAFREGWWGALGTEALLPGDVISMRAGEGGGGSGGMGGGGGVAAGGAGAGGGAWGVPVPADLLLLRGRAVANEACLTGESVPQTKDALTLSPRDALTPLDTKREHRSAILFAGTELLQHGPAAPGLTEQDTGGGALSLTDPDTELLQHGPAAPGLTEQDTGGGGLSLPDTGGGSLSLPDTGGGGLSLPDTGGGAHALPMCPGVPGPPDGGCVCFVLATGFASSQGELMRLIEFSTDQVGSNKLETLVLLLLLLAFALAAAGYVFAQGVAEGKKSKYELALRCVLIITSVVPPELPMQTALAVNTALLALHKAHVFCTEPFRVPMAGRITHTLFDKTGTITTDELTAQGVVNATPEHAAEIVNVARDDQTEAAAETEAAVAEAEQGVAECGAETAPATAVRAGGTRDLPRASTLRASPLSSSPPDLLPMSHSSQAVCAVIGGCHSLAEIGGRITGDPIEIEAINGIGWGYTSGVSKWRDPYPLAERMVTAAEARLARAEQDARAQAAGKVAGKVAGKGAGGKSVTAGVGTRAAAGVAGAGSSVAATATGAGAAAGGAVGGAAGAGSAASAAALESEVVLARSAVGLARAALERARLRREGKMRAGGEDGPLHNLEVTPVARHHFSSSLQRMSAVALARNFKTPAGGSSTSILCLVKGSPESLSPLLRSKPGWYDETYTRLAQRGLRVLALGYRLCEGTSAGEVAEAARRPREWVDDGLECAGMLAFGCAIRSDSAAVIGTLIRSGHRVAMLTGDAPLTALHVARQVGIAHPTAPPLLLSHNESTGAFEWIPALAGAGSGGGGNGGGDSGGGGGGVDDGAITDGAVPGGTPAGLPFSVCGVRELRSRGHELVVVGRVWTAAVAAVPEAWRVAELISVYARMSPEGKEAVVRALNSLGAGTLMCGDGGNDVGALKAAHVGISLLSGFGSANAKPPTSFPTAAALSPTVSASPATATPSPSPASSSAPPAAVPPPSPSSSHSDSLASRQASFHAEYKSKEDVVKSRLSGYRAQEAAARQARGQTGYASLVLGASWSAFRRMQTELVTERQALARKYGLDFTGAPAVPVAGSSPTLSDLLGGVDDTDGGGGGGAHMVRVGDASVAAPFTSKLPSILSVCDVIRQGHCTLVSAVQQQQILVLHCLISAYSLSVLSLEGSRSSETQLMASGVLLSIASIAFSFARPVDSLSPVLPLPSIFHPALALSVLGQLAIHAACMLAAVRMATSLMGEAAVREAVTAARRADRLAEAGEEEAAASAHRPNLLNTVVFLVETAQQVSVMLVNYKGRPWMKGPTENPALLYSLAALVLAITAATLELFPPLNSALGLVPMPSAGASATLARLLAATLLGTFAWDRLCLAVFAPRIARAQLEELSALSLADLWGPNSLRNLGIGLAVAGWLYFLDGNVLVLLPAYYAYRKMRGRNNAAPVG